MRFNRHFHRTLSLLTGALAGLHAHARQPVPTEPAAEVPSGTPRIVGIPETADLGVLKGGEKTATIFTLRNEGDAPLEIKEVRETCGCTVAELPEDQRVLQPGQEVQLPVSFDSTGRHGKQSPRIRVITNDPERRVLDLVLLAEVTNPFILLPSKTLAFQNGRRGQDLSRQLKLIQSDPQASLDLLEFSVSDPSIKVRSEPLAEGETKGLLLTFSIDLDAPLGDVETTGKVRVKLNGEESESDIIIRGLVIGDLAYRPNQLYVMKTTERGKELPPVIVSSMRKQPFEVLKVDAGPFLVPTVSPRNPEHTEYNVVLTLAANAPAGALTADLLIHTNTLEHPLLRIPTFVNVAAAIEVDPLLIRLTKTDSMLSHERRVRLKTANKQALTLVRAESSLPFVKAEIVAPGTRTPAHVGVVMVRLDANVPPGEHRGELEIETSVPGAERLEIPIEILEQDLRPETEAPAPVEIEAGESPQ